MWTTKTVSVLIWISLHASSAQNDMTLGTYGMALSGCYAPYAMELVEPLVTGTVSRQPANSNSLLTSFRNNFIQSCSTSLDKTIQCHAKVDDFAGYRIVNTARVKSTVKKVCAAFDSFSSLQTCIPSGKAAALLTCINQLRFNNDVCAYARAFKVCVTNVMNGCPQVLQTMFSTAVDTITMDKCVNDGMSKAQRQHQCTGVASMLGVGMCYAPFITKMIIGAGANNTKGAYEILCGDGSLDNAISCHSAVQTQCGISFIDTNELATFKTTSCTHLGKFETFGTCLDGSKAMGFLQCVNAITIPTANMLCGLRSHYQSCLTQAFTACTDAGHQAIVNNAFNLISLNCPSTQGCSLLEHGVALGMCWYPTVQTLVPWQTIMGQNNDSYDAVSYLRDFCGRHRLLISSSIRCHVSVDQRCGNPLMTESDLTRFYDAVCINAPGLVEVATCVPPSLQSYYPCAVEMKNFDASANDFFCRIGAHMKKCVGLLFTRCSPQVKTTIGQIMDIFEGHSCSIAGDQDSDSETNRAKLAIVAAAVLANPNLNNFAAGLMN